MEELKRSLTTIFGNGKGFIPEGAYLDAIQIHNLTTMEQVDQVYEGFIARGTNMPEKIGALAALLDYRDGTNLTGLNPEHRHYVRHIGITGHQSSPVLMSAIRRDMTGILDTVLVALNANDRLCSSHQNNVLPLAVSRGMGVIAMKIFADGAYYGKEPRFSRTPADVIHTVGKNGAVANADLVRYPLSLPGRVGGDHRHGSDQSREGGGRPVDGQSDSRAVGHARRRWSASGLRPTRSLAMARPRTTSRRRRTFWCSRRW